MDLAGSLECMVLAAALLATAPLTLAAAETSITAPQRSDDGILTYTVTSEYLAGPNAVEVLLPDRVEDGKRYPVLYILPVNPGTEGPWGSGIQEARRLDVHNKFGLICIAPAFDSWPWYADHPTNLKIRQESYLLKVILPLIEDRHPTLKEPRGRLLIGFSKSGWGAFSLLLRHPDVFGRAAAWDAPLMEQAPAKYEMGGIFAAQENFEKYKITALLDQRAELLKGGPPRLILMGYGNFRDATEQAHARMVALGIPHQFDDATRRKHDWHSGWFAEAVRYLMQPDTPSTRGAASP